MTKRKTIALVYRPVGNTGEPYPGWLTEHRGQNGVYVIRVGGVVQYVGESHAGRLVETVTRHLQRWRRARGKNRDSQGLPLWSGLWSWLWGEPGASDPGYTFDRDDVEVAIVAPLTARAAVGMEERLIRELKPALNRTEDKDEDEKEDAPF